jgi:radical SAM superfamily enzyme YgiQ (UPF0313 family)
LTDILLTTQNASYAHCAFGLRYLLANLGALRERAKILEFVIGQRSTDVLEVLLKENPRIVGVGVYIWNAAESLQLVAELKRLRPEVVVVVGGPEVSHEIEAQEICALADHVVAGEADLQFAALCRELLQGGSPPKVIEAPLPNWNELALPYAEYTAEDLAQRVLTQPAASVMLFSGNSCRRAAAHNNCV